MISVKNLSFKYPSNTQETFSKISFDIKKGDILSIIGKNGVGKTTLLKCITGNFMDFSGEIFINGKSLKSLSVLELSKHIAVVSSINNAYQNLLVADYLVMGFANKLNILQTPNKEHYKKAIEVLADLNHGHLFNKNLYELSTGEMQMVKIARAILQSPDIIIFDEPTSNLDAKNQLIILNQLSMLSAKGFCIITTTHNPGHAIEVGGFILMMSKNKNIFGKVKEELNCQNISSTYDLDGFIETGQFRDYIILKEEAINHNIIY